MNALCYLVVPFYIEQFRRNSLAGCKLYRSSLKTEKLSVLPGMKQQCNSNLSTALMPSASLMMTVSRTTNCHTVSMKLFSWHVSHALMPLVHFLMQWKTIFQLITAWKEEGDFTQSDKNQQLFCQQPLSLPPLTLCALRQEWEWVTMVTGMLSVAEKHSHNSW